MLIPQELQLSREYRVHRLFSKCGACAPGNGGYGVARIRIHGYLPSRAALTV